MNAKFFLLPLLIALAFAAWVVLDATSARAQEGDGPDAADLPQPVIAFVDDDGEFLPADLELSPGDVLRVQVALADAPTANTQATAYLRWAKLLSGREPLIIRDFAVGQLPIYSSGEQTPQIADLPIPDIAAVRSLTVFVVVVYDADGPGEAANPVELIASVLVPVGRAKEEVDLPPDPEVVSARILARRLSDGRMEFAVRPDGEDRILPRSRWLPENSAIGRWLNSSVIEFTGKTQGRISARRLSDGRVELSFLHAGDGNRILPTRRMFPAGDSATGWMRSSLIEIAESGTPSRPIPPLVAFVIKQERLSACYGETITVSTQILRDGQPAPDGTQVTFSPLAGKSIAPAESVSVATVDGHAAVEFQIVATGETSLVVVAEGTQTEVTLTGMVSLECESVRRRIADLYVPDLRFSNADKDNEDSKEIYHPVSVDVFLKHAALLYEDEDTLCRVDNPESLDLDSTMELECNDGSSVSGADSKKMVLSLKDRAFGDKDETDDEAYAKWWESVRNEDKTNTAYALIDLGPESQIVIQYWFFYVYQPGEDATFDVAGKNLGPGTFGAHEGDWESIIVVFSPNADAKQVFEGAVPDWFGFAEHKGGQRYATCQNQKEVNHAGEGTDSEESGDEMRTEWPKGDIQNRVLRPVVYVAYETHASYGWDGSHQRHKPSEVVGVNLADTDLFSVKEQHFGNGYWRNDRDADVEQVILMADQPWLDWSGRWGSAMGPKHGREYRWFIPAQRASEWQWAEDKWPDEGESHCVWVTEKSPFAGNDAAPAGDAEDGS